MIDRCLLCAKRSSHAKQCGPVPCMWDRLLSFLGYALLAIAVIVILVMA